ncbi:MAG TPA: hypothetical protein VGJ77_18425 [Gaiellaceae bacterium]
MTGLLLAHGSTEWSWLAGPVAALAIWALDYEPRRPREPEPARVVSFAAEPEPVD